MIFIGFDGKRYESLIAESNDFVHWDNMHLAMGYGPEGELDHNRFFTRFISLEGNVACNGIFRFPSGSPYSSLSGRQAGSYPWRMAFRGRTDKVIPSEEYLFCLVVYDWKRLFAPYFSFRRTYR